MTSSSVRILQQYFVSLLWMAALAGLILFAYRVQIQPASFYLGYRAFPLSADYLGTVTVSLLIMSAFVPTRIRLPSDFFCIFYGTFVLMPFCILHNIRNQMTLLEYATGFTVLIVPLFIVTTSAVLIPAVRFPYISEQKRVIQLLLAVCLVGISWAIFRAPDNAGFTLADSYARRLQGREMYPSGSLIAYMNSAIVNGVAPTLAFLGGLRNHRLLLLVAFTSVVIYFYLIGLKAPLLLVALSYVIGWAVRRNLSESIGQLILCLLLGLFALFSFEYLFLGYSYVGDYILRRAFGVTAYLITAFLEFIWSVNATTYWSLLDGIASSKPVTFIVGENFLGVRGANANTNTFLHALAGGGLFQYVLTIILVATIFLVLNASYRAHRNKALLYLGFLYGLLLTEQAATTALLSSGLGALMVLFLISNKSSSVSSDTTHLKY